MFAVAKQVLYGWSLNEPLFLLFLPSQDRLKRSEKVLIFSINLFAQAFTSMVFFNPDSFTALLGKPVRDDCFAKSTAAEDFTFSNAGIATAVIIKFVIVFAIKNCLKVALLRALKREETVVKHFELGKWKTQKKIFLSTWLFPIIYLICYFILLSSVLFCLVLGYSLTGEKYRMW